MLLRVWVLSWDYKTLHIKLCYLINMKLYVNATVINYVVAIIFFSDSDENEAGEVYGIVSTYIYIYSTYKMSVDLLEDYALAYLYPEVLKSAPCIWSIAGIQNSHCY